MKRIFSIAAVCGLILTVSCTKNGTATDKEFSYNVPSSAIAGQSVKFEDLSIGVSSREWTFEDGEPATSTAAVVNVTFKDGGDKAVKLTVNFSDGTSESKDFAVKVLGALKADIKVDGLTAKGCAKKGSEITFSLENVEGEPTSYNWTFQGGTPGTSTEASPKVIWNSQIDDVKVTCELTRESDGAKTTVETAIIAGNYPLLRKVDKYDVFGFEGTDDVRPNWIGWASDGDQNSKVTVVDGGSASQKCMRVDATSYLYLPGQAGQGFIDVFHRNNWTNNATLEVGKKYVMSFDIKAQAPDVSTLTDITSVFPEIATQNKGELGAVMEIAWIYCCTPSDGLYDSLRDAYTAESWKEYYGKDYVSQTSGDKTMHEFRYTSLVGEKADMSDLHFKNLIKGDWQTLSDEFTLEVEGANKGDLFYNCFISVRCTGYGATFFLDNFRIDEVE